MRTSGSLLRSLCSLACREGLIRSHRDAVAIQMSVGQMFMSNAQQIKCLAWQCPRQCHRCGCGCRLPALAAAAASKRPTLGDQSGWVFHNFYELHTRCGMSRLPLKLHSPQHDAIALLSISSTQPDGRTFANRFSRSHVVIRRHPSRWPQCNNL